MLRNWTVSSEFIIYLVVRCSISNVFFFLLEVGYTTTLGGSGSSDRCRDFDGTCSMLCLARPGLKYFSCSFCGGRIHMM